MIDVTHFRIERRQARGDWFVLRDGREIGEHGSREEAATEAQKLAMALADGGVAARIECVRDDGTVSDVWLYGGAPADRGMAT